jgi:hypothetical protein
VIDLQSARADLRCAIVPFRHKCASDDLRRRIRALDPRSGELMTFFNRLAAMHGWPREAIIDWVAVTVAPNNPLS